MVRYHLSDLMNLLIASINYKDNKWKKRNGNWANFRRREGLMAFDRHLLCTNLILRAALFKKAGITYFPLHTIL